jgi:hypothetical protein
MMRVLLALGFVAALLAPRGGALAQSCPSNASGPDELRLTVAQAGSDLDLGWTGADHDLDVPGGARFRFCLQNCDTTTDSLCDVAGQAGDATVLGRRFAAPIPLVAGGIAVCIFTSFRDPFASGTADVSTGAIDVVAGLSADIHLTSANTVCPKCTGATAGASGICTGGTTPGSPCVTDEVIAVAGAVGDTTYEVSRNCLPTGVPSTLALTVHAVTGTSTLAGLCPGQSTADGCAAACGTTCTPAPGSGVSQNCCTTEQGKRCFPTQDTGQIARVGAAGVPLPAFPDPTYPKTAASTVVAAVCAPTSGSGTLDAAAGLPGPAAFVLPVNAEWLDSSVPVTTTTTIPGGGGSTTSTLGGGGSPTTTSTTLPVSCAAASDCDDGDPCTTDDCPAGTCTFSQQPGTAGADCELADFLARPPCTLDAKLLTAATTLVGKARTAVQVHSLPGVSARTAAKAKKRADRALKKLGRKASKAARKAGRITPPGCEATIASEITRLRALVAAL